MPFLTEFLRETIPPAGIVRLLSLSNLAKTAGHGILMAVSVLYFTRTVGIPVNQVGLALSLGAAVGMLGSIPAGHLADRFGPRAVTIACLLLLGVFASGYALVTGFAGLVVAVSLALMAESATDAARGALVAGLIPPAERVRTFSYMRSVANIGIAAGATAGGIALYFDTRAVYLGVLVLGGVLFLVSGAAYFALPSVPATATKGERRTAVLRDRPYVVLALLNTVLVMHITILTVALPIWITTRTSSPAWTYSVALIINTAMVVLLQVRVGKGSEHAAGGGRALRRTGLALAACCALFALAQGRPVWLALLLLVAGVVVHTLGEMLQGVGQWSVSFSLAPEHTQGQYQGLFAMSVQLGTVATPALATYLLTHFAWAGWVLLAVPLALAGLAAPLAVRWAEGTRDRFAPRQAVPETTS
ncbi:MFS transporter [Streptomyces sp. NPDC048664]|uniref:MFS transporter n=1 Tax=Streptomyces sp. NPDC048664 TaxID=3154505 RepID=UPI0034336A97